MAFNMVSQSGTHRSITKIQHDVSLLRARMQQTDPDFNTELAAHTHAVAMAFAAQLTSGKSFSNIAVSDVLQAVETHMSPNFQAAYFRLVWEGSYVVACGNTPLAQLAPMSKAQLIAPDQMDRRSIDTPKKNKGDFFERLLEGSPSAPKWNGRGWDAPSASPQPEVSPGGVAVPADDAEVVDPDCEALKVFAPDQDGQEKAEALKQAKFAAQRAVSDTDKLSAVADIMLAKELAQKTTQSVRKFNATALPAALVKAWDFGNTTVPFEDHLNDLEDFLLNQPQDDFTRTGYLQMSLSGGTATAFRRVLKANRDISYDDAVAHIRHISVDRDLRRDLHSQMEKLSMKSGERMDNFLSRADLLRQRCSDHKVQVDNFHFRLYIERAIPKNVLTQLQTETDSASYEFPMFIKRIKEIDHALNAKRTSRGGDNRLNRMDIKKQKKDARNSDSDDEYEGLCLAEIKRKIQSQSDKRAHQLFASWTEGDGKRKKLKGKFKHKSWTNPDKNKKQNKKQVHKTQKEDLSDIQGGEKAKPELMKKFYSDTPGLWEKRLAHDAAGNNPKDAPELYNRDRWDGRFVCWGCRCTGHTSDKCFNNA